MNVEEPRRDNAAEERGVMPQPPQIVRRIRLRRAQWVGMPLIALLPALAVAGLFGESRKAVVATFGALTMSVEYPTRSRYKVKSTLRVSIANTGRSEADEVTVRFRRSYLEAVGAVKLTPEPRAIDGEDYSIDLGDIPAGATRSVELLIGGESYGRASGEVRLFRDGRPVASVPLRTLIYP